MPRLFIERGPDRGKELVLRAGQQVVVGRDPAASFPLSDPMCSRKHIGVGELKGSWLIKDLGSNNGSFVNGKPLEPDKALKLEIGASINIGDTLMSFLPSVEDGSDDPLIGSRLGGYRIDRRLGRGAMGVVYQARQMSLGRDVALKVLSDDVAHDEKFVAMFVKEARAAATLNHQNILQVYDVTKSEDKLFIAMELATSGSVLDELRQTGSIPLDRTISIIRDALQALEYAERKGLVHRDIKPDNLMITTDGVVKLGDLGLAARAAELSSVQSGVFGTPHYIAPEQAQGKAVDHRADLYALGATWYRLLTGNTLFQGASVRDILKAQVREPHVPLRDVIHDIPPAISAIVDKMLAKEPDQRYQSATHVLEDISAFLANRSYNPMAMGTFVPPPMPTGGADGAQVVVAARRKGAPIGLLIGGAVIVLAVIGGVAFVMSKGGDNGNPQPPNGAGTGNDKPVNPGENTGKQQPIRPVGKQSNRDALLKFGGAQTLEGQGKLAEALVIYEEIAKHYPEFVEADQAKARITELKEALKKHTEAVERLRSEWTDLAKRARDELAPAFQIGQIRKAIADFDAALDANGSPEAAALKAELNTAAALKVHEDAVDKAFSDLLQRADAPLQGLSSRPIEERPGVLVTALEALRSLKGKTDCPKLQEKVQAKLEAAEKLRSSTDRDLAEHRRVKRVEAATAAAKRFHAAARKIGALSAAFSYREAKIALDEFVATEPDLAAHGESKEFADLQQMIADRRHQTELQEEAMWWLSRNWSTPGYVAISGEPLIAAAFPNAAKLRISGLLPGVEDDPAQYKNVRLKYGFELSTGGFRDKEFMDWNTMDAATASRLIVWVLASQKGEDPKAVLNLLKEAPNARLRLGLGAALLEAGQVGMGYELIEGAYNLFVAGSDAEAARRAREYMAFALAAWVQELAGKGEHERAKGLYNRLMGPEFAGTRARE